MPGTAHVLKSEPNGSTIRAVWQVLDPARWRRVGAKRRHKPEARGNEVTGHGVAVEQRGIGDGSSEGSRPVTAGYHEGTG